MGNESLTVKLRRVENRRWIADARAPPLRAFGRTIESALRDLRRRIRGKIEQGEASPELGSRPLATEFELPEAVVEALAERARATRRLRRAERAFDASTSVALRLLIETAGVGLRDAGQLLGVSPTTLHERFRRNAKEVPADG